MQIDHIFIFSKNKGKEADQLIEFGLTEGNNRRHKGQGTVNRKFYFDNFFLEILWVYNEEEVRSKLTAPTKLWERSRFNEYNYSPFGLCLVNTSDTDKLFSNCFKYQPQYFPQGMHIDMITNAEIPFIPMFFRLPFRGGKQKKMDEPCEHKNGMKKLTKVKFEMPPVIKEPPLLKHFRNNQNLLFVLGKKHHLTLEFDEGKSGKDVYFEDLLLTIKY